MATKIRLQRHGRGKRPFFTIVVADSRARRDGKFIERIGDYNPLTSPAVINLNIEKAVEWLQKGAEATNTVNAIFKYKGVLVRKHLLRGVTRNAFSLEEADKQWQKWLDEHKNAVLDHQKKIHKSKADRVAQLLEEETKKKLNREAKRAAALTANDAVATEEVAPVAEETTATEEAPAE